MGKNYNIYLGKDLRELRNLDVCIYSLRKHSSNNIPIHILDQEELRGLELYWRATDERAATQFSLTRFLVPYIEREAGQFSCDYSIFLDSDNIIRCDISEVFQHVDPDMAVSVVKHDYIPKSDPKMGGRLNLPYPRKNWSSFIVFNNRHPANDRLTLNAVNSVQPSYLHRFGWLEDFEIGSLPLEYNYLVGEDMRWSGPDPIKNLHFTLGTPIFPEYTTTEYADVWLQYEKEMNGLSSCLS